MNDLRVVKVVETSVYVKDLRRAHVFYEDVLGLEVVEAEGDRHVFLKAGKSMLLLFRTERTLEGTKLPSHGASGSQHFALQIEGVDYDAWKARLMKKGIKVEQEVTWDGSRSIYFRDPDGNLVELITSGSWPVDD